MSLGGGSSAPATTTTISKSEPPEYVKPYYLEQMRRAEDISNQPYLAYGGQRIAGLTPEHYQALNQGTQLGLYGDPAMAGASDMAAKTFGDYYMDRGLDIAGQYNPFAGENPYLASQIGKAQQETADQFMRTVNPQLAQLSRQAGAFGHSGVQEARADAHGELADSLGNVANNMRMQNYLNSANLEQQRIDRLANMYGAERGFQAGAMEFAPSIEEQVWNRNQNLLGIGDIYRNVDQQGLDVLYDEWNREQQHPLKMLDIYQNAVGGFAGAGRTNTTSAPNPYAGSQTANMIGGGLTLAGLLGGGGSFV